MSKQAALHLFRVHCGPEDARALEKTLRDLDHVTLVRTVAFRNAEVPSVVEIMVQLGQAGVTALLLTLLARAGHHKKPKILRFKSSEGEIIVRVRDDAPPEWLSATVQRLLLLVKDSEGQSEVQLLEPPSDEDSSTAE
jgi:hypothetical protein